MDITQFIGSVVACLLALVAYFIKKIMDDMKEMQNVVQINKVKIEVMETDHTLKHQYLNEKFDVLNETMKDLTIEIKNLRTELHEKKSLNS
jgi:hypothetical protein